MPRIYFTKAVDGYLYGEHTELDASGQRRDFVKPVQAIHESCASLFARDACLYAEVDSIKPNDPHFDNFEWVCANCQKPLIQPKETENHGTEDAKKASAKENGQPRFSQQTVCKTSAEVNYV
jgi:hypothetical protein